MSCQRCKSENVLDVHAKCGDLCSVSFNGREHQGEVPRGSCFGRGDYIEFCVCTDCGQMQGLFPANIPEELSKCSECGELTGDDGECGYCANCGTPCCVHEGSDCPEEY